MPWTGRFSRGRSRAGATARALAQRTPRSLTVARHHAQPTATDIIRLAGSAILAYLLALPLPGTARPVLAPLTALLVVQVTLYSTVRSAVHRVASVVAGVLLGVTLSTAIGFNWWSLAITIITALTLGHALRLGEHILEVPISAMLILSVATTRAAATGRIADTLAGAAAGLAGGLLLAPPRVQPAEEAIEELARRLAALLEQMAAGLLDRSAADRSGSWLDQARALAGETRNVDRALGEAEDSIRLNPRGAGLADTGLRLRGQLQALEHSAITIRGIARSLADSTGLSGDYSPMRDPEARARLARALRELAAALRTYGELALEHDASGRDRLAARLNKHLAAARQSQDFLSEVLGADPAAWPVGWPLRGELVSHLDRLRTELEAHPGTGMPHASRPGGWRRHRPGGQPPRSPQLARRAASAMTGLVAPGSPSGRRHQARPVTGGPTAHEPSESKVQNSS
jgi:Aromatic acid exporter family member 1